MTHIFERLPEGVNALRTEQPVSQVAIDKATTVLTALTNAGLKVPYHMELGGPAEEQWGAKLNEFPLKLLLMAASDWVDNPENAFPTLAEFHVRVVFLRKELHRQEREDRNPKDTTPCFDCDGNGWVDVSDQMPEGYTGVQPCERCQPDSYAYWRGGHSKSNHNVSRCDHPTCVRDAKRYR